ncbi:YdbC family protein [Halobacillus ihumii]|uniref:YdbC family protein n=1 Tax=Halobacillus ihumii TaxID=2686092 RepID=UPI0013D0045A|nr:YdbC family protein [Halobacillus ihumii]
MIIKWIVCNVPESKKEEFSYAQSRWKSLSYIKGFLGQIGGWDSQMSSKAGILSFWKDFKSYRAFMENDHDKIFETIRQANTYRNISVEIFSKTVTLSGADIIDSLKRATFARVATYTVPITMTGHVEEMQEKLEEGLSYQDVFASVSSKDKENKCLLASFGRSRDSYQKHVDHTFSLLRRQPNSSKESLEIAETLLELEEDWLII